MNHFRWTALAAMLALTCASSPQSGEDSVLTERVRAALVADDLATVRATVVNGVATLTGTVETTRARDEAQVDAERVEGVHTVANRIRVRQQ